jgi:Ca2+-binding RTX toxin-like protein
MLAGGAGADAMTGGNGNDTYVVENIGDTADESSGSGVDTVNSTVSFTLAGGIENLVLNGASAINGTGNAGANSLYGNSAANRLDGNGGADTLTSFGGADVFVFDDADGADTITDFANGSDNVDLTAVAGVDEFSDLTVIDNGATVTVNYGTGTFTLANIGNAGLIDASDFIFA